MGHVRDADRMEKPRLGHIERLKAELAAANDRVLELEAERDALGEALDELRADQRELKATADQLNTKLDKLERAMADLHCERYDQIVAALLGKRDGAN